MHEFPLVSIIISSYNYGRFLPQAIDSALNQTYPNLEVIVVDDGSTDDSPAIITGYGSRIVPLLRRHEGPVPAWNAAFQRSRGTVICFLDSDDMMLPTAVEAAVAGFDAPDVVKVHWPLWEVDADGNRTGRVLPYNVDPQLLAEGNLRDVVVREGPASYVSPPTSGNAWARWFLERVFPVPEVEFNRDGDAYVINLAPVFGSVRRVLEPQACYRVHGSNDYASMPAHDQSRRYCQIFDHCCVVLRDHLRSTGTESDPEAWKQGHAYYQWMKRVHRATERLATLLPPGETFILVDEAQWGGRVFGDRENLPFVEREGRYWGAPADDAAAIAEFERLRRKGASYIVFAWPAFWWLDYYQGLHQHLATCCDRAEETEDVVVFRL